MDVKISIPTERHKETADRLREDMSYSQHYAYLLDWYMNDRNGWRPDGKPKIKTKTKRMGNIFTRLVNSRRLERIGKQ